ncbi:hypothetical protein HanIR_Chr16g0793321 [Helianthus annuus]|nr:hypothetical protein HanIR_Chr16g0793321 [Helianthus annuus]
MAWFSSSLSEDSEPKPMVPRRTRIVTKPQRIVILMLFRVLWIWRLPPPRRRLRRPPLAAVEVGRVEEPLF